MSWENRNFKELGFLGRGKSRHRPRNDESLYGGDYPMIQTGDVKAANFYLNSFSQTYNDKGLAQSKLWNPNTLCITIAANIAETAILGMKACFPDSIIGFIADEEKSDVRFIKYFFDIYKERMQRISQGATQDNLSLEKLLTFEVPTPPLQTQKRIADILSAYDDLIENNLKRINLLEQAAQNIHKEWFVNLRFPGHEDTPINEETGLPVGWGEKEISSIITFLGGYAFKSKTYIEIGKYRVITIKNVGDKVFNTSVGNSVDSIPDKMKEHCKIIEGDILLSLTGNVGRSCIAYGENNLLNQRVAKIVPTNKNWLPYIYWMFNDNKMFSLMNNLATGAAQQNLSPVKLAKEKVVIPSESVIDLYCLKANSVFKQIILLNKQNQKLKVARDILLPRLMNRTIEV